MSISALNTSWFIASLVLCMGIATPSHAQAIQPVPPTPIDVKKVELGGTPWNPQWDQIIEKALPPEMLSSQVPRGVRRFCPRFYEMGTTDKRTFWAYFFQALAGAEAGLNPPLLPNLFRVIRANMGCKLLVPLQLEVAPHFIERCAGGGSRRFEPPVTFGATKTPKMLFLNPYQLSAQSASVAACQRVPAFCQETKRFGSPLTAPLAAAPPHCSRRPSPSSGVEEDAQKRLTKVYMRHF